ncbi:12832_t:CDS:2 [Funneliformis mosseae]|uniref:12832_t:CDS:1 n=1 Tax=Funneliformis mosseae TaxID=27381 RepID=A0A9N9E236_FUNMO|nr:12832_t:CDS:2 [Funneliformis mosseae]
MKEFLPYHFIHSHCILPIELVNEKLILASGKYHMVSKDKDFRKKGLLSDNTVGGESELLLDLGLIDNDSLASGKSGTESESEGRYKTDNSIVVGLLKDRVLTQVIINKLRASFTKDIPQPINEDASLYYAIASEETIIPDLSPKIEYNQTKSEESEIQYSASPSANSLLEDDTSKQMLEDTSDKSDITSNSNVY